MAANELDTASCPGAVLTAKLGEYLYRVEAEGDSSLAEVNFRFESPRVVVKVSLSQSNFVIQRETGVESGGPN